MTTTYGEIGPGEEQGTKIEEEPESEAERLLQGPSKRAKAQRTMCLQQAEGGAIGGKTLREMLRVLIYTLFPLPVPGDNLYRVLVQGSYQS